MREYKIGEIFEYNGEWYQCLESSSCRCDYCDYGELGDCHKIACTSDERSDDKEVYFKKLEKFGEPYISSRNKKRYQLYRCFCLPIITKDRRIEIGDANWVGIEIKQTKEDMEIDKVVMNIDDRDYLLDRLEAILHDTHCQQYKDEICEAFSKYIVTETASGLKPFDLNAAKSGKPVYTRDGRKARIISFDAKYEEDYKPIIALIDNGKNEFVVRYNKNGECSTNDNLDLMMSLEKKEEWINIYEDMVIYESKEEAELNASKVRELIATAKVKWEE